MRSAVAATALGMTLTLAGLASCAGPDDPVQPPGTDPSSAPVFASDEEALAAAEELYGRYYSVTNALGEAGWVDVDELDTVLAEDALAEELDSAQSLADKGYHQVGEATFDSLTLQQVSDYGPGRVNLILYACSDVTGVDVVDEDGDSVVSGSRPDRQPIEVEMSDAGGSLKIVRREPWSGASFC